MAAYQLSLGRGNETRMKEIKTDGLESTDTPSIDCVTALQICEYGHVA